VPGGTKKRKRTLVLSGRKNFLRMEVSVRSRFSAVRAGIAEEVWVAEKEFVRRDQRRPCGLKRVALEDEFGWRVL
jgi:hypothetical protein